MHKTFKTSIFRLIYFFAFSLPFFSYAHGSHVINGMIETKQGAVTVQGTLDTVWIPEEKFISTNSCFLDGVFTPPGDNRFRIMGNTVFFFSAKGEEINAHELMTIASKFVQDSQHPYAATFTGIITSLENMDSVGFIIFSCLTSLRTGKTHIALTDWDYGGDIILITGNVMVGG